MLGSTLVATIALAILLFLICGYFLGSIFLTWRRDQGIELAEIKDEIEVRKNVFTIIGGVSLLIGAFFSFHEYGLKQRAEDRQTLYGALGQLIAVDDKRPEISAAALLQLERLGADSFAERPALIQIITGYLNERAKKPVDAHDSATTARPDIQMAVYVLSNLLKSSPKLGKLVFLKEIDLRYVQLSGAQFSHARIYGADFSNTRLIGSDLSQTDLSGSSFKDAVLEDVNFDGSVIDFVSFDGADLSGSDLCAVSSSIGLDLKNIATSGAPDCAKPSTE